MKKIFVLLAAILTGFSIQTKASHVAGGDIRYECVGQDSFLITMNFYRDCSGINAPSSLTLQFRCTEFPNQVYTQQVPITFQDEISQLCDAVSNLSACQGGPYTGMEWYQGTVIVDLSQYTPTNCTNWVFSWAVSARNPSENGFGGNYYVETEMNNGGTRDCNNSPFFTAQPIPYVCTGQDVSYSFGVGEIDGDSLVYSIDTAFTGYGAQLNYQAGFNPQQPFGAGYPVNLDQQTGQLTFTAPPLTGNNNNYILVVKVREYDPNTGEFLGSATRDIQLVVIDCLGNQQPQSVAGGIQNFSGSGGQLDSNSVVVCYGQNFTFELEFVDYDSSGNISNDSIFVTSNITQFLPGATFTATQGNPVTVNVSWTAPIGSNPFSTFNFFVEDNACPVPGIATFTYDVKVVPATFLGADTLICAEDTFWLDATGGSVFNWEVIPNPGGGIGDPINVGTNFGCDSCRRPWILIDEKTTFKVTSDLAPQCGNTDTITIDVFQKWPVDITSTSPYCVDELLDTLSAPTPGGTWIGPGIANPVEGIFVPGAVDPGFGNDTTIQIIYALDGTCGNTDTADVIINGFPDARIKTEGPFCEQTTSLQLEGFTSGGSWAGPNVTSGGEINPSAFSAPDTVRIFHTIDDGGCVFTDSADFRIISEYNSTIDSLPKLCVGENPVLLLNNFEGDPFGVWSGDNVTEVPAESGDFYFNFDEEGLRAGSYTLTYEIPGDCGTTSSKDLLINPLPDASIFGADSVYCDNIIDSIQLETASENGIWGGNMNELHDGYFIPSEVGEGLYTISYELYDTLTTCYNKEVVEVRIARTPVNPRVMGGGPYCQGDVLSNLRADGLLSNTFKWFEVSFADTANGGTPDTLVLGAGNPFNYGEVQDMPTVVYGTQISEYGCESGASRLEIEVLPSPIADFVADTLYGNAPLEVSFVNTTGPDSADHTYLWDVAGIESFTTENIDYLFEDIGEYRVSLVASNIRCSDEKVVTVIVDRLTNFFIPNVFTPNKDGSNDELDWEIEGIGEFEIVIYNRWGGKVFSSTDLEGTWDGASEPSGVYFYVVTGKEETLDEDPIEWRGDVTLIRD